MSHARDREDDGTNAPLHAQLVDALRDLVVRGALPGGERISEATLCARFGVSRTPLREALKALAVEGFIELRPNRGAAATRLSAEELAPIFEAKGALERFIGLNAATRIGASDLAHLERLHERLVEAHARADADDYTRINNEVHAALAAAAGNPVVCRIYAGLQAQVLRARHAINTDPAALARSVAEHEGIMAALRVRARLDLAERLEQHNAATGEAIIARIRAITPA